MALERVDKILASCTLYSRKEIKKQIQKGAVLADGSVVLSPEQKYDPLDTVFVVDGAKVQYQKQVYLMLNKPSGYVSATEDRREKTVLELISPELRARNLFPAGRLDKDTTGFILLTDDGIFAHEILSPKHHVSKTYHLTAARAISPAEWQQMEQGMSINGTPLLPASLSLLDETMHAYEIRIREGKYHQIKRMFSAFGNRVLTLRRVAIGGVPLDETLAEGQWRHLTAEELLKIKESE